MSQRKDLYRFSAQVVVGGVLILGKAPATGLAAGATGLAGLAGLIRDKRNDSLGVAVDAARRETETALHDSKEFTDADFTRAYTLLETAPRSIDPAAFAAAARTGPPEPKLTADLIASIDFQPDDQKPRHLLSLVLDQTVQTVCSHPSMQAPISRAFHVQNAQDNAEILALVRDLRQRLETSVPEVALIALARKIQPRVKNREDALNELERATDIAAAVIARGEAGSNLDVFVNDVLHQLADLTAEGRFDDAATLARTRLAEAKAGVASLRNAAIDAELLAGNAAAAATLIAERVAEDTSDPAARFGALFRKQEVWYNRGRDKGLRLDLEVAIELARIMSKAAANSRQRGIALISFGNAFAVLGEFEAHSKGLKAAIDAYRAAQGEFTRRQFPIEWATAQHNLGNTLSIIGRGEASTRKLKAAVDAFRAALRIRTRDRHPQQWARTQNSLGLALLEIGKRGSFPARLNEAVNAFNAALRELTRDRAPLEWAGVQDGLGSALANLGEREIDIEKLEAAHDAFRAALLERTQKRVPLAWASTQNNIGNVLSQIGKRKNDTETLEAAIEAFREALKEMTRERSPLEWASMQHSLGAAFQALGESETCTARLEDALTAYRAALEERTRDHVPLDWATTQNNLGNALRTLGQREAGTARLEEAVAAYRAALEERTRDHVPLDWAMTRGNMANLHLALYDKTASAAELDHAQAALDDARAVFAEAGASQYLAMANQIQAKIDARRDR